MYAMLNKEPEQRVDTIYSLSSHPDADKLEFDSKLNPVYGKNNFDFEYSNQYQRKLEYSAREANEINESNIVSPHFNEESGNKDEGSERLSSYAPSERTKSELIKSVFQKGNER